MNEPTVTHSGCRGASAAVGSLSARERERERETVLSPGLIRTVAGLAAVSILGPLERLSPSLSDSISPTLDS